MTMQSPRRGGPPDGILAIDIGGTKLAVAAVDSLGRLHAREQCPTPSDVDPAVVLDAIAGLVERVRPALGGTDVVCGVGCGGPMAPGGTSVSPLNIAAFRDFPLRDELARLTGVPTAVDNDAKAFALAEGWRGAARGVRDFVGMVVSTGVGGGLVVDGRLLDGASSNAGHIGHVEVVPGGERCSCGAHGCLEAEASGTAIARLTGGSPAEAPTDVRERTGRLVGAAVAQAAILLDLDLAVAGGSVALGYGDVFFTAAQAEIERRCSIEHARSMRIVPPTLGDEAPLVGAAAVALRAFAPVEGIAR